MRGRHENEMAVTNFMLGARFYCGECASAPALLGDHMSSLYHITVQYSATHALYNKLNPAYMSWAQAPDYTNVTF